MTIGAVEGGALVARGLVEMLLVGLDVLQGVWWRELAVLKRNVSERGGPTVRPPPLGQIPPAVQNLDHLELGAVVIIVVAAVTTTIRTVVLCRAAFPDRDEGEMQVAAGLRRRGSEKRRCGGICALEHGEVELCRCVGVLQGIDHLLGRAGTRRRLALHPVLEQGRDATGLPLVARRLERAAFALAHEIVDERCPAARGNRENLVHAVGIEGGERHLGWLVAGKIELRLPPLVANHDVPAGRERRQREDERPKHARLLLSVAVTDKEAAFVVDEELVEAR